jgi:exosortase D (VPLPA-CTERM-specific)
MLLLGTIGAAYSLQQYALVLGLAGLALAWTGWAPAPHLVMPFLTLLLMVPQPDFILNNMSAQLQLWSSNLGVLLIRAAGISVFLEGNIIDLGGYRLQVVEACAGLRYLFPLMTIGMLIAYFYRGALWKRALVFLASIPVTILMNSLRIGIIGLMVDRWGSAMAEGFLHDFQGWMVFMLSAALLLAFAAVLNRIGADARPWREAFGVTFPGPSPAGTPYRPRPVPRAFLVALGVLVAIAAAEAVIPNRTQIVPDRGSLAAFPHRLGEWQGRASRLPADVLETLQLDDYALLDYVSPDGQVVNLYASYYATQRDRRVVHSPAACLPGSGWRIEHSATVAIGRTGVLANRMLIANGNQRALVYYWFDQRGRNLTNEFLVKWFLFQDAIATGRSDGAMVRILTMVRPGESEQSAQQRLDSLVALALPPLATAIPR